MKSLAIEREYGTGGWELGKRIAQSEKIPFYDERTIIEEAGKLGYELSLLKNYEEKKKESILYNIAMIAKRETELKVEVEKKITQLFHELKDTVERLQAKEPAVFVGLGVSGIINNQDDFVRVYLHASRKEDRIRGIQKRNTAYTDREIRNHLEQKDKHRSIYFRCLTQKNWIEPQNYDCVYDVSKISQDIMCKDIIQKMKL